MSCKPLLATLLASILTVTAALAETIHVSPKGNDGAPGSAARPIASLSKVQALLRTRPEITEIVFHEGTYAGGVNMSAPQGIDADKAPPLHFRAAEGEKVIFDGANIFDLSAGDMNRYRNQQVGFVFQFYHLLPEFTALENTMLPALIRGEAPSAARARAEDLLSKVGLDHRLHHRPMELSGGEQQRVALARAVVRSPDIVLADEPTGNLDPRTGAGVHELFLNVSRDLGVTVIVATHNRDLAGLSDRRLRLREGRMVEGD